MGVYISMLTIQALVLSQITMHCSAHPLGQDFQSSSMTLSEGVFSDIDPTSNYTARGVIDAKATSV
ncbi:hypothetical protein DSO57_1020253 [Entomophthora muscae]|uniref:Uncharacterized protein n=1 Tax=Entomophthora muscae TaxID=34485 RepID=A0ACC2UDC7_9FUNG|nr:hypothetical protein DSO57_1020253 [Entomophthora muscae]